MTRRRSPYAVLALATIMLVVFLTLVVSGGVVVLPR
jgi:hypothetical protein